MEYTPKDFQDSGFSFGIWQECRPKEIDGKNGTVRTVKIKTKDGYYIIPSQKLCLLEETVWILNNIQIHVNQRVMSSLLFGAGMFRPQRRSTILTQQHIINDDVTSPTYFYELTIKEVTWSCYSVYRKTFIFMINYCVLFSLLIAGNSKSLLVYCLFVSM